MAVFHITAPDGVAYEINAPDNASEQDILSYAQANHTPDPQTPVLKNNISSHVLPGVLAFGQGGLPVFDEAGAAGGSALANMGLIKPISEKGGWSDEYYSRLQNIRDTESAFHQAHPAADTGLRLAGGIASAMAAPETLASKPILGGAAYGAAQGFLGNESGAGNRIAGGAIGAGLGAGTAAIVKYAVPPIMNGLAPREAALATPKDIKAITDRLDLAGIKPEDYAASLRSSGPDEFAGELGGDPLRIFSQGQAKITGPNMQAAREAMRMRLAGAPERVQGIIENTFKPNENIRNMLGNLDEIGSKLPDLYDTAAQDQISRRAFLNTINTPAGQQAMKSTVEKLANQGINLSDAGIVISDNGFHGLSKTVPVSTLHEFSKSLGDLVERNPLTGAIETSDAGVIEGLRKHATEALAKNSPSFAKANMNAAAQLQGQAAFDMGRKLAKTASAETGEELSNRAADIFSPNELSYQKIGFQQGLQDLTKNTALGTGNPAANLAKTRIIEKTSDLVGPTEAQKFADALMQEKNRIDFAQRGLFNSNTAETLASDVPEIPTSPHGLIASLLGKVKDALGGAGQERMASLLYATSPEQKQLLANSLMSNGSYFPENGMSMNPLAKMLLSTAPAYPVQTLGALYNQGAQ